MGAKLQFLESPFSAWLTARHHVAWVASSTREASLLCRSEGFPRTGLCCSWVREGKGPGQEPGGHESPPSSPPPPSPGGGEVTFFTNGHFYRPPELLRTRFSREFRWETHASSQIIEISIKMQVSGKKGVVFKNISVRVPQ